jgi:proteasome lid subunit RPN8/RPN11
MPSPALLRFSPFAWAKLVFLRDLGPTEIGGFGITSAEHFLQVDDFCLVRQRATGVTVRFEDHAVADFFDLQVDLGRTPAQFARIWIHTHPGSSPLPSAADEATFARCFGQADWSVMFILACGGRTYARLHFRAGPGGDLLLPVEIDFSLPFAAATPDHWEAEYGDNVVWGDGPLKSPPEPVGNLRDDRETCAEPWFDDPRFRPLTTPLSWEVLDG